MMVVNHLWKVNTSTKKEQCTTRAEYFQKQRDIGKLAAKAEQESTRRIREAMRKLIIPLVAEYAITGILIYPVEELARQTDHIIREEAAKPVLKVRELQKEMEQSLAEKLHIIVGHKEPHDNAKHKRLENTRKPVGSIIKIQGKGFAGYYRDPVTGNIIWDDLPLEYEFRKRNDLSGLVWKAVEDQEEKVMDVILGGRAAGRDVKRIAKDLEVFIKKSNGGEIVQGRWMGMFPNTEAGRRAGWERDYLKEHGGLQYGTDAAKNLLKQDDAKLWIDQKMKETTKR